MLKSSYSYSKNWILDEVAIELWIFTAYKHAWTRGCCIFASGMALKFLLREEENDPKKFKFKIKVLASTPPIYVVNSRLPFPECALDDLPGV